MTFTDSIAAMVILSLFLGGFSRAALPALNAWRQASEEYRTARDIRFVAESFRKECVREDRNIERWKKAVAATYRLESCEITEYAEKGIPRALRLTCSVAGEPVEVIGACMP